MNKSIRKAVVATVLACGLVALGSVPAGAKGVRVSATLACDGAVKVRSEAHIIKNVHIVMSTPEGETRTVIQLKQFGVYEYAFDADDYPGFIGVNIRAGNNAQPGYPNKGDWVPLSRPASCPVTATINCDGLVTVTATGNPLRNVQIVTSNSGVENRTIIDLEGEGLFVYTFDADDYPGFIGVNVLAGQNDLPGYPGKGPWFALAKPADCGPQDG